MGCVMAVVRVIMGLATLAVAGAGHAAAPQAVRLPLSLHALETGSEVSYHPNRWLTIRRAAAPFGRDAFQYAGFGPGPARFRSGGRAMTGDIHPFGGGFRLSLGVREDANRRPLRSSSDRADVSTERYAPLISIGYGGEITRGLSIGGDIGLLGRTVPGISGHGAVHLTPLDMVERGHRGVRPYQPLLQLSADYRF